MLPQTTARAFLFSSDAPTLVARRNGLIIVALRALHPAGVYPFKRERRFARACPTPSATREPQRVEACVVAPHRIAKIY